MGSWEWLFLKGAQQSTLQAYHSLNKTYVFGGQGLRQAVPGCAFAHRFVGGDLACGHQMEACRSAE